MDTPDKKPEKDTSVRKISGLVRYSGMAMQMLGTILIFTYAGYRLDAWQQNKIPMWTLILSLVSIAASLYLLITGISRTGKQ
jgi:hypothetical protein